jgi:hypothetical protein
MGATSLIPASRALAGPWSTEPLIGVTAQYVTNPEFSGAQNTPTETHAALFANVPMNYDGDELHFALTPSARYGDTSGYSSVTSNYYHVDSSLQYTNEFNALTLSGSFYRDASLQYAAEVADGISVRRDTSTLQASWLRTLTERLQFDFSAFVMRTLYAEDLGESGLVDFKYSALSPYLAYSINERDTVRISGGTGRYDAVNGLTSSQSSNLQLGLDHRLTELWTVSSSAGYSRATNDYKIYFGPFYLGTEQTQQKGAVYSLSLARQGERLNLSAAVSRYLTPTGFTFLSRQDIASLSATFNATERWSFAGTAGWSYVADPQISGGQIKHRFYSAAASATWCWTEHWRLGLHAAKVDQQFGPGSGNPASSAVSIEVSRQFNRTNQ